MSAKLSMRGTVDDLMMRMIVWQELAICGCFIGRFEQRLQPKTLLVCKYFPVDDGDLGKRIGFRIGKCIQDERIPLGRFTSQCMQFIPSLAISSLAIRAQFTGKPSHEFVTSLLKILQRDHSPRLHFDPWPKDRILFG